MRDYYKHSKWKKCYFTYNFRWLVGISVGPSESLTSPCCNSRGLSVCNEDVRINDPYFIIFCRFWWSRDLRLKWMPAIRAVIRPRASYLPKRRFISCRVNDGISRGRVLKWRVVEVANSSGKILSRTNTASPHAAINRMYKLHMRRDRESKKGADCWLIDKPVCQITKR